MPYRYTDFSIQQINKDGTTLGPLLSFTPATTPVNISRFAIGNRARITFIMQRFGGDSWTNKFARVNLSLFGPTNIQGNINFGFESDGFVTAGPVPGINRFGTDSAQSTRINYSSTFDLLNPNQLQVTIDFYLTFDIGEYISTNWNGSNFQRFTIARRNYFNLELQNPGSTVYNIVTPLGITTRVFDGSGTDEIVLNSFTGFNFWDIPFSARWYNSDYLSITNNMRYLEAINITCPSQIAAGIASLTNATSSGPQSPPSASTDSAFVVNRNQLAVGELNTVRMTFQGASVNSGVITTVTNVRVLLIKSDAGNNLTDFISNYEMSEAIIPAAQPAAGVLDGALNTPSSWTQNPVTGEIQIQFDVDGNQLDPNFEYRMIVNFYETVNPDRQTTHITPALVTSYVPPVLPNIDGYLGTYSQEYQSNELNNVAPHQRVRCRLDIDKTSYSAGLAAFGITGTFDDALLEVSAELVAIIPDAPTIFETYKPNTLTPPADNTILTDGMLIVNDDVNQLNIAAIFRIDEGRAGTASVVRWTIKVNQPSFTPGVVQNYEIQFDQILNVIDFENNAVTPKLLNIRFLDLNTYPATKTDLIDICDVDQFIAEIEKDPALLTGSNNLIATIYPGNINGETTTFRIEEEESWQPAALIMPISVSGKLDSVETSFGADEFATWRINGQQLTTGVRYWVTGIVFDQFPDYCPIGLVQNTSMQTFYFSNPVSGWTVIADKSLVTAEITGHPDYVGGITTVYQRIVDSTGVIVGYPTSVGDIFRAVRIDPALGTVYVEFRIDAQFDPGTGPHTISHTFRFAVPIPPIDTPAVNYLSNTYVCTDLG